MPTCRHGAWCSLPRLASLKDEVELVHDLHRTLSLDHTKRRDAVLGVRVAAGASNKSGVDELAQHFAHLCDHEADLGIGEADHALTNAFSREAAIGVVAVDVQGAQDWSSEECVMHVTSGAKVSQIL